MDSQVVLTFLKDLLGNTRRRVIMQNAPYDLGWLRTLGIQVRGPVVDIKICESLIEEEHPEGNSLDAMARRYLNETKNEDILREAAKSYGFGDPKKVMHKLPPQFVGPYAEADARQTMAIYRKQLPRLEAEGLMDVLALECRVTPHLLDITAQGTRIDVEKAQRLNDIWKQEEKELLRILGMTLEDVRSPDSLARAFLNHGHSLPTTEKGNVSIKKEVLDHMDLDFARNIQMIREFANLRENFIEKQLLGFLHGDRIHPHYVQLAREEDDGDNGTRSGRLSGKQPNEQQVPKRSSILIDPVTFRITRDKRRGIRIGKIIRSLRLPEEGCQWAKLDYNSQEPRWMVHYGLLRGFPGATEALDAFNRGVKIYSHMETIMPSINYDDAKQLTLARGYGLGVKSFSRNRNISKAEGRELLNNFDKAFPFLKMLADETSRLAADRGYVRTFLGRRRHFNFFQSKKHWDYIKELSALKERGKYGSPEYKRLQSLITPVYGDSEARNKWKEGIQRAFTHKAFNAIVQGTSGDQAKTAVCLIAESELNIKSLVHDEINASVETEKQAYQIKEIMETVFKARVPFVADLDLAAHWQ